MRLLLLMILAFSFTADAANINGYKDIQFGDKLEDIQGVTYTNTRGTSITIDKTGKTLFGFVANYISADLKQDQVTRISVELQEVAAKVTPVITQALGAPLEHFYVSYMGYEIEQYIWLGDNGTAITVTRNKGTEVKYDARRRKNVTEPARVEFLDQAHTAKLMARYEKAKAAPKNQPDAKDF